VIGGGRVLNNDVLQNLNASPDIIRVIKSRKMRGDGHVARMGKMGCTQYFRWKTYREEQLRRPRHRWEDNIQMDVREMGLQGVDWMHVALDMD